MRMKERFQSLVALGASGDCDERNMDERDFRDSDDGQEPLCPDFVHMSSGS
jgi:hypothetical protein